MKKKVPVKISKKPFENAREKNILPVKILWNSTRETEILTREKISTFAPWKEKKKIKFTPVKQNFEPVKKSEKIAREKKSAREKTPKSGRETVFFYFFARENNAKKCKKWLSRALLSFTWEKKNTALQFPFGIQC